MIGATMRRLMPLIVTGLSILGSLGWCAPSPVKGAPRAAAREVEEASRPLVRGLSLTVSDLPRARAFFRALGFTEEGERELSGSALADLLELPDPVVRVAALQLGTEQVELREFESPKGRELTRDPASNDQAFQHMAIVVRDMDAAYLGLQRRGVRGISSAPQTIPLSNPAAGGIKAYYFRDHDRHALELIWYPPGKGDPRWQVPSPRLFLGIDHTAIAVVDSDKSQALYEALGFFVAGRSLNFGPEQVALSGVPKARVRITGLHGFAGPGVEFLSYLEPGAGAPRQASRPNDTWHWEITVQVADVDTALRSLERLGGARLSKRVIDVSELGLGYEKAAIAVDRDGHSLRLVQP